MMAGTRGRRIPAAGLAAAPAESAAEINHRPFLRPGRGPVIFPVATRGAVTSRAGPRPRRGRNLPARLLVTLRAVITTVRPHVRPADRAAKQACLSRRNSGIRKYPVTCGVRA
jgi:hypothetical protein